MNNIFLHIPVVFNTLDAAGNFKVVNLITSDADGVYIKIDDAWVTLDNADKDSINNAFADIVRFIRNNKLAESDWTQLEDVNINKEAWKIYRQALRDFMETCTDYANPIWPTRPDEGGE